MNWRGGVEPGERRNAVAYWREFKVPDTWRGNRIKLKCDAIFNDARVWINGSEAGAHVGNFTPFELDITELVKFGHKNVIAVAVRVDWEVDHMAWATAFVGHSPLGILRKIYLFAVPQVNVADVHVLTTFDKDYHDAVLTAQVHVVNESDRVTRDLKLRLGLRGRHQAEDAVAPVTVLLPEIQPGGSIVQEVAIAVPAPRKWDAEHPNLYDLSTALLQDGLVTEVTKERIGFRQVEIRGSQVLINNQPVRYRGVVWHETDPRRGRSLTGDAWHRDMQLLRAMNCNYIRLQCVSGPPAEELVEACDEVGIFLENELPVCWSSKGTSTALSSVLQAAVEMVIRDRSRASVIQWSLGNELLVDQHLMIAHRLAMKHLDSSRPYLTDGSGIQMPIRNDHYTSIRHFYVYAASPVPVMQGEWGHVNCYNRQEIYTDPGVRDIWAYGVAEKWNKMVAIPAVLGGSIWTGVDEMFLMPDGTFTGWGQWGFLDIWRRKKPEYWHFKKIFTPIYLPDTSLSVPGAGQPLHIPVENRHSFSDLKEIRFDWALGAEEGTASTSLVPGAKGVLKIPLPAGVTDGTLELKAYNHEGLLLDAWRIGVGNAPEKPAPTRPAQKVELLKGRDHHVVRCGEFAWEINTRTGKLVAASVKGKRFTLNGPELMILPLSGEPMNIITGGRGGMFGGGPVLKPLLADTKMEQWVKDPTPLTATCSGWTATSVQAREAAGCVEVRVDGVYREAEGRFVMRFTEDGAVDVQYDFKVNKALMANHSVPSIGIIKGMLKPRQLGLVFDLPDKFDTLAWRRQSQWTYYPEGHIGRPEGSARPFPGTPVCKGSPFYRSEPTWPWPQDCTPMGSADFRSTKANIYEASVTRVDGVGVRVVSDGSQHVRAWVDGSTRRLLVSDVNCEGSLPDFFKPRVLPSPQYRPGDSVKGSVRLNVQDGGEGEGN